MWELQDEPYAGDVINAYNDGPPDQGGGATWSIFMNSKRLLRRGSITTKRNDAARAADVASERFRRTVESVSLPIVER